jgi:Protein of unknown function (DUF2630)
MLMGSDAIAWLRQRAPSARTLRQMTDQSILDTIHTLMVEEHELSKTHIGGGGDAALVSRLGEIDVEIDRQWDLLRQRRALRRAGDDPDRAILRPPGTVEGYQQ